jgi:Arc/MetJ-type ribon-helix-helix transcriptional regulator
MATLTVQIPDALMERLDREVASGRYKDSSVLVQQLLESAMRLRWQEQADQKIEEALDDVERGDVETGR